MVTRTTPEIDWSTFPDSDGEPMAETSANAIQMVDLQWMLQTLFDLQGRLGTTTVGGNQFVYYNRYNGRDNISPDVYVIFDRTPPRRLAGRRGYRASSPTSCSRSPRRARARKT